ncbi:MAG: sulfatase [Chloroflexota bacterium]|nr:sulfatase [Chloroflexota bacterium]
MNVIVVCSDTLRRDHIGAYGAQPDRWASGGEWCVETPNIDRFVARAALFEDYHVGSFPTVPNRHEVFTGRAVFTYAEWAPLPSSETILSETLADAGYTTMLIADTPHILQNGFHYDRGFSAFDWIRGQENDRLVSHPRQVRLPADRDKLRAPDISISQHLRNTGGWKHESDCFAPTTFARAASWLEDNHAEGPFFLHVDTFDPHEPWDPPQWYVDKYDPGYTGQAVTYPVYGYWRDFMSPAELRHAHARYCGEVSMVDRWLGVILDTTDSLNLWEDTALLFLSDHGFYFGEHDIIGKSIIEETGAARPHPLYPEVTRIPLIAHIPGVTNPGQKVGGFVQPMDLMPTFLELAGIPPTGTAHGASLLPLVRGEVDTLRDCVVSSHTIIGPVAGRPSTIRTPDWTLILGAPVAEDTIGEASGAFRGIGVGAFTEAIDSRRRREVPGEAALTPQLYNNHDDPGHTNNVIAANPGVAADLRDRYIAFLESVGTADEFIAPRAVPDSFLSGL